MRLRTQLLLVSLLLLTLPWAGCQFIRETESTLRQGQEQSLQATATTIAAVLARNTDLLYPYAKRRSDATDPQTSIYAAPTTGPVIIDGYGDGWDEIPTQRFSSAADAVQVQAQTQGDTLYLLFKVRDDRVIYHNPGFSSLPNGDRLILRLWHSERRQDYVIATAAPGSLRAVPEGRRDRSIDPGRILGHWQDASDGYSIELEVPLEYTGGRLGFFVIDEDSANARGDRFIGNTSRMDATAPPWLIIQPQELRDLISTFASGGGRWQVVDRERWTMTDLASRPPTEVTNSETFWLLRLIYRNVLSEDALLSVPAPDAPGRLAGSEIDRALGGNADSERYAVGANNTRTLLSAAAPIRDARGVFGAVVVQQSADTYLSLTDQAFTRLLAYSLLALGIGALGMLGFATVLSWRIRSLSNAAAGAIAEDGRVIGGFKSSNAKDELGDLSRQYGDLLSRLQEHNDYLRTLSRKLSHELRTPIAVIQSSLENLAHSEDAQSGAQYHSRAHGGLQRLQQILTAMSEASRLEESIHQQEKRPFNLSNLIKDLQGAYSEIYPAHTLLLDATESNAIVDGVPDLIVQALDKLVDNAASFAPAESEIVLRLQRQDRDWVISVENAGPPLPEGAAERMFEPMTSLRESNHAQVHLGLGLHIVRLIVDFHAGRVEARNLDDAAGVVIMLSLPALDAIS